MTLTRVAVSVERVTPDGKSKSYWGQFFVLAIASLAVGAYEVATGATTTGFFLLLLSVVLCPRIAGKLPPKRFARMEEAGTVICPRCHERKLTADPDESYPRYCWGCGATVDSSDVVVSP
jgi:cytochrome c553